MLISCRTDFIDAACILVPSSACCSSFFTAISTITVTNCVCTRSRWLDVIIIRVTIITWTTFPSVIFVC
jgi:hypothetical protein